MNTLNSIDRQYIEYLLMIERKNIKQHMIQEFIVSILVFISLIGIAYGGYKNHLFILIVGIMTLVILLYLADLRKEWLEKEKKKQLGHLERDYSLAKELKHMRENAQGHTTYDVLWRYSFDV